VSARFRNLTLKAVFVNRFFHPDHSATSQILSELAFALAAAGWEVHVVTARQRYDDPRAQLPPRATLSGVQVHRVWTTSFGRGSLPGRALDYLTFYCSAFFALLGVLRRGDVVVAKTDPPLISVIAAAAARLRGAALVNWLQDLFPEVAEGLGVKALGGMVGKAVRALRDRSLRGARSNVVIGDRMAEIVARIAPGPKVIHNWAVGDLVEPIPLERNAVRREWELGERFVVGYSGNLGRAHEFDTILAAIEVLREDDDVLFLFIGAGKQLEELRRSIAQRGLGHRVMFQPYQPKERLAQSLASVNAHLVTLQPSMEGLIVPSKFYGIAAAARPTLFVGDPDGEIPRLLRRFDCGYAVATGDADALVACIRELRADPSRCERVGANARAALEHHFDRAHAVARWSAVLAEAAGMSEADRAQGTA
jgi:glycosyltransferase involved in cell wall biosynthesis